VFILVLFDIINLRFKITAKGEFLLKFYLKPSVLLGIKISGFSGLAKLFLQLVPGCKL
jgi:hypothetical protein